MISAFVNRRPWPAALIGLLLSPFVGMLYLGKGRLGLVYLFITWLLIASLPVAAHLEMLPLTFESALGLVSLFIAIVGAVHCHRVATNQQQSLPRRWFARWYALLLIWGLPIAFAFAVRVLLWEPFNIPSSSMEPSLPVGDNFFVSKFAYGSSEPLRGDIVVFRSPEDNRTDYVKRLIGLPGDRVQMKQGSLHLNDVQVLREKVDEGRPDLGPGEIYREKLTFERSYLIREMSDGGYYDDTEVYEVPSDHYFFLGDNRDNSLDSRANIGFVPRENLIGPVVLIYWNSEAQKLRFQVPD